MAYDKITFSTLCHKRRNSKSMRGNRQHSRKPELIEKEKSKEDKIASLIAEIRELDELKDLIIEMKQQRYDEIERIENEL